MATYASGARGTGPGTNLLPMGAIVSGASVNFRIKEIGVFNTTATGGFSVGIARLTTAGTPGAGLAETPLDHSSATSACTAVNTYTSTGPTLTDLGYRFTMGAAIGSGVVWTFPDILNVNAAVANGIGLYVPSGTGQICDFYFVWEE